MLLPTSLVLIVVGAFVSENDGEVQSLELAHIVSLLVGRGRWSCRLFGRTNVFDAIVSAEAQAAAAVDVLAAESGTVGAPE